MKAICNFCTHQKRGVNGRGVGCDKAVTHSSLDGYGEFKHGANCVHDADLKDHFSPRTGDEISVQNMVSVIAGQAEKLMHNRERIAFLEKRLTTVDGESK